MNYKRLKIFAILILLSISSFAQDFNSCKFEITKIVPKQLLNSKGLLNVTDLIEKDSVFISTKHIDSLLKQPLEYYKLEFYKEVTKEVVKYYKKRGNKEIAPAQKMLPHSRKYVRDFYINDTILYRKGILFIEKRIKTDYSSFIKITPQSPEYAKINQKRHIEETSVFSFLFFKPADSKKNTMQSGIYPITMTDIENKKFKITKFKKVMSNQYFFILSKDDFHIVGCLKDKYKDVNLFIKPNIARQKKQYEASASFTKSFLIASKNLFNYKNISDFSYYKPTHIRLINDNWFIGVKEFNNSKVSPEREMLFKISELESNTLYYYDCFYPIWKAKKNRYEQYLIKNFTKKEIQAIRNGNVFIGMQENALYESIGRPLKTNTTIVSGYTNKQCVYGSGIYIYIENQKVKSMQNFESFRGY